MGATVLITGSTGFLGKVVLSELMRRKQDLGIDRCVLLIRSRRKMTARQRFEQHIAASPCFSQLPLGWSRCIDVVEGDLSAPACGIQHLQWRRVAQGITHVIHCAASVDFDLPIQEACKANITSSLNMLELAKKMAGLQAFVSTSTSYVTPHRPGPLPEALAPLPRPAQELLAAINSGADEKQLLAETGHANTYTYTKCLAEHLLVQHRGQVPLSIVRPSIISASLHHPMPGWIDSKAAFAGFVVMIGAGLLKVVDANPEVKLDIVPVDHVAAVLIDTAFGHIAANTIVHAVASVQNAAHIGDTSQAIVSYFRRHRVARRPWLAHLGSRNLAFEAQEALHHRAPAALARAVSAVRRDGPGQKRLKRLGQTLRTINKVFPYFTHNTFAFQTERPLPKGFNIHGYVQTVCRGAHTFLMAKDRSQTVVAGRALRRPLLATARGALWPEQGVVMGAAVAAARGLFGRLFDRVTFDEPAFVAALAQVPKGHQVVLVPTHRSYLDFLVLPYVLAVRKDLGLGLPSIVAADRFLQRPVLGPVLRRLGAIALPRLAAARPLDVAPILRELSGGRPLMVFLEGERSRGRRPLPLRQDVIAALKDSGQPCALVPVGISYERIAEESPFLQELQEGLRKPLRPRQLFAWLRRAQRHQVHLGRVHVTAGRPVTLHGSTDVATVTRSLQERLGRTVVATDFHLEAFVRRTPRAAVDVPTLRDALRARGATVLRSHLRAGRAAQLDARLEASTRSQWAGAFDADLLAQFPQCEPLQKLLLHKLHGESHPKPLPDAAHLRGLYQALGESLLADCRAVAAAVSGQIKGCEVQLCHVRAQLLMQDSTLLPDILAILHTAGLIAWQPQRDTVVNTAARAHDWQQFAAACVLYPQANVTDSGRRIRRASSQSAP